MLHSTIELISLAASNSLAVFCFCNLIIAILLVGSSKPSPQFDQDKPDNASFATTVNHENFKKTTVSSSETANMETRDENTSPVSIDMVDNEVETSPDQEQEEQVDDDEDDELRKRVEEFIEKINRGWRAEKLKTSSLGQ